jgi:phosphatidylglycerol---prolipoprotein diacylglyceryl transferase
MAFIHWDVSPVITQLGPFTLRWYGLFFALLFWLGFLMGKWMFRTENKNLDSLNTLLVYLIIGTIVGARLGHCLFYEPGYYLWHPLEVLKVWEGGLASHGGALGVMTALYLYSRKHPDQPMLWLLDRVAVATALAGVFIRVGNLFNSEILGSPTHAPWAFVFERVDQVPRHPAQLYEALAYGLIFLVLFHMYRRAHGRTPRGLLIGIFFVSVFSMRFVIEFVKERQVAFEQNMPLDMGQLLSIPFIVLGLFLVWRARRRVPTLPKNVAA